MGGVGFVPGTGGRRRPDRRRTAGRGPSPGNGASLLAEPLVGRLNVFPWKSGERSQTSPEFPGPNRPGTDITLFYDDDWALRLQIRSYRADVRTKQDFHDETPIAPVGIPTDGR